MTLSNRAEASEPQERRSLYRRINDAFARKAGPAQVGPYEPADRPPRVGTRCPICGHELSEHSVAYAPDRRKVLSCPG